MNKRILWMAASCVMALSLLVAACGPAAPTAPTTPAAPTAPTTPTTPTAPAPTTEKPQQEAVKPAADTPKYGGSVTYRLAADPTNFDSGTLRSGGALVGNVYQQYMGSDWLRGPAGSGIAFGRSGRTKL